MGGGVTGGEFDLGVDDNANGLQDLCDNYSGRDTNDVAAHEARAHDTARASAFARMPRATAKEKLLAFLQERPAGADSAELVGLLFKGAGSDPELGARLIHGLIGGDPAFVHDESAGLW